MPYRKENREVAARRKSLRILCAEDDKQLALLLKYGLQQAGHFVECVEDGKIALERLQEDVEFFDLLITDHNMPRISGLRLVESVRRSAFRGRIIVHSSQLPPEDVRAYENLKVDFIFTKPLQTGDLLKLVRSLQREMVAAE